MGRREERERERNREREREWEREIERERGIWGGIAQVWTQIVDDFEYRKGVFYVNRKHRILVILYRITVLVVCFAVSYW